MGDPWDVGYIDEVPVHTVTLSPYKIGEYEITNREYAAILNWALVQGYLIMSSSSEVNAFGQMLIDVTSNDCQISWNGSYFMVDSRDGFSMKDHPVAEVTWYGAAVYCNWLSEANDLEPCYDTSTWECDFSKTGYHLPTEAQWERAAAWDADSGYHYRYGNGSDSISSADVNYSNSNPLGLSQFPYTSPTGYYTSSVSPVGCYDMSGNVWEWCNDWYMARYYSNSPQTDPQGPSSSPYRVLRGGCFSDDADPCSTSYRTDSMPTITGFGTGFRIAKSIRIYTDSR